MLDSERITKTTDNQERQQLYHHIHWARKLLTVEEKGFSSINQVGFSIQIWTFFKNKIGINVDHGKNNLNLIEGRHSGFTMNV